MSTLQISLAIVGLVVLAAVLVHGAWTSRKNVPKQASQVADANTGKVNETPTSGELEERREPEFDNSLEALARLTLPEKKVGLDALIDVIAAIAVDAQVSGEAALAAMPSTRRAGSTRSSAFPTVPRPCGWGCAR